MIVTKDNFSARGGSAFGGRRGARKEKSEFDQKVLDIRRVTRVVAGGKRFRFRATVILGDHKGRVGVGVDKGADTSEAIEKASRNAKKCLISVPIKNNTIPHEIIGKFSSAVVLLKPAGEGRGIVAGGPVRAVVGLAGIANITSKILGTTTNKLNNARATIEALKKLKTK
ncbi:MAG: 30S ribosomal protein S5 [Candidatus Azambacteria bacterium]|nr:30S ribosomal protein S5 [Candidatus Azambacteria bacterium]